MIEREVSQFSAIAVTNTASALGMNSYLPIGIPLDQDFGLSRVVRETESITLSASFFDYNGAFVDPDGQEVDVSIYNHLGDFIITSAETRSGTGIYSSSFTPPASSTLGIYKAVHSATVSGSAIEVSEFFRVVASYPGSYAGQYIRGEDTIRGTAQFVDSVGNAIDPTGDVTVKVTSSTGVDLIIDEIATRTGVGEYIYDYSPQVNDPVGIFRIIFTGTVGSVSQSHQQFFEVVARKEPLIIDAQEFRSSSYAKRIDLTGWENTDIEDAIMDAQAAVESYLGYKVFSHVVTGERHRVNMDRNAILSIRLNDQPIVKLIRVILRYDPFRVLYTLPANGFEVDHERSIISYNAMIGEPIPGTTDTIARNTSFAPWYDVIVDYEAGLPEAANDLKMAVKILTMSIISGELAPLSSAHVKKVKSGNYEESYFDTRSPNVSGALSASEQRAYSILRNAGYVQPGIA
jgi:hypothetical protein